MSSDRDTAPVIIAEGVSKRYLLGEREQYRALRDVLAGAFRRSSQTERQELWAVKDVSFSVAEGEVVGIIGRNGAGKSTLLKILSRITTPTEGEVRMRGRIGSLLEVGSGFHPELTGYENVFLNGAILGMGRAEIKNKLDEIVAFAEMEPFITTPVKHYSVGMFMRLAFAVAAHLDAEILVVDEVLAVGDAKFQAKCLAKMGEVARSGRSVLFVSHNLEATQALCDRGLLLEHGRLDFEGTASAAVEHYRKLSGVTTRSGDRLELEGSQREGTGEAHFVDIAVSAAGTEAGSTIRTGDRLILDVGVEATKQLEVTSFGLTFSTEAGLLLLNLDWADLRQPLRLHGGLNRFTVTVPELRFAPGRYRLGLRLANPITTRIGSGAIDLLDPVLVLQVDAADGSAPALKPASSPDFSSGSSLGQDQDSYPTVTQGAGSLVAGEMAVHRTD